MIAWLEAHPVMAGFWAGFWPGFWAVFAGFALVLAAKVYGWLFMRTNRVRMVNADLRGQSAIVKDWSGKAGIVVVAGERWRATACRSMTPGSRVIVTSVNGLRLDVDVE